MHLRSNYPAIDVSYGGGLGRQNTRELHFSTAAIFWSYRKILFWCTDSNDLGLKDMLAMAMKHESPMCWGHFFFVLAQCTLQLEVVQSFIHCQG